MNATETKQYLLQRETIDPQAQPIIHYANSSAKLAPTAAYPQGFPSGLLGNQASSKDVASIVSFEALGRTWKSTEYLYMIGRWSTEDPANVAIQEDILSATSGYQIKRYKQLKYKRITRPDFLDWRHEWMLWVVWQKCLTSAGFRNLLLATGDATIVEVVRLDPVWAAWPDENGCYVGANGMGKILMLCREALRTNSAPSIDTDTLNAAGIYILGQKVTF